MEFSDKTDLPIVDDVLSGRSNKFKAKIKNVNVDNFINRSVEAIRKDQFPDLSFKEAKELILSQRGNLEDIPNKVDLPVVITKKTGNIQEGLHRALKAKSLGMKKIKAVLGRGNAITGAVIGLGALAAAPTAEARQEGLGAILGSEGASNSEELEFERQQHLLRRLKIEAIKRRLSGSYYP